MLKNKRGIIGGIIGASLGILAFTNPSEQDHRDAVMNAITEKVKETVPQNEWEEAGQNLGLMMIQSALNTMVHRSNYVIFSLTDVSYQGETRTVGVGILGKVYLKEIPKQQ